MKSVNDAKPKVYNRLFVRIYLYFAIILVLFAVLLGFTFMNLYEQSTMQSNRTSIEQQATRISAMVSGFMTKEDKAGYDAYQSAIESLEDPLTKEIWIVANWMSKVPMDSRFTNALLAADQAPAELREVLEKAFYGYNAYNKGYDDIYEVPMLRVAVPVYDAAGNVVGAVMIASQIQSQKRIIDSSKSTIVISAVFALLVSFIIAILFARQISRPISRMRVTALELAQGEYNVRTDIRKKDEIGDLAGAIDSLSVQLKENEQVRENMEQMRRDFFANVSHELRTPITVLLGYTEMLADGVVSEEDGRQQYYDRMKLECHSMERLVGDLLTLSKLQNSDFMIEKEPVNLVQIFDDIVRGIHVIADQKNIKIFLEQDCDRCMMLGDYDRLRQMFLVIIDNAIKFSNEGGSIYIKITSRVKLCVSIADRGVGISPEELPYIFEKFYKSKLRQNASGSGLGLVIARQIALRHDGTIEVESHLGVGTTFYFSFDKIDMKML